MTNITVDYDKVIVSPDAYPSRVPAGTIALWENSTQNTIPNGWALFNMGDRFPRGIASGGTPGNTTDNTNVSLNVNNFKSHTHGVSDAKYASGNHTHGAKTNVLNVRDTPAHSHTYTTSLSTNSYNHNTHSYGMRGNGARNVFRYNIFSTAKNYRYWNSTTTRNFGNINHTHSATSGGTASSNMNHYHDPGNYTYSSSSWTHNTNNYTTGSNGTTNHTYPIIPKHINYVFIIKQ